MPAKKTPAAPILVQGFKVTNKNMQCRSTQFALGQEFTLPGEPILCENGYHFCKVANDCFNYYPFDSENRVFAVEAFGKTVHSEDKSATLGIRFVKEYTWLEVLTLVNQGKNNTGRANSGDRNSGNRNSGDLNSGNLNSGNLNSGNRNSGDLNSGNLNSGNLNSGNRNSGDWNSGDRNSGVFCSKTPTTILLFNKPSEWSHQEWLDSEAAYLRNQVMLTQWRPWPEMTDAEKEQYPRAETAGGYLIKHDYKEAHRTWWATLDARQRACFASLPNFNPAVFKAITGIDYSA